MPVEGSIQGKREGGSIWLVALIVVGALWATPIDLWHKLLLNWALICLAFASVRCKQRYLSRREAIGSVTLTFTVTAIAWLLGFVIERRATDAIQYSDNEVGNLFVLASLIALCVILWLMSAIWIRASAESGGAPARTLATVWSRLSTEAAVWSFGLVVILLHQVLLSVAFTDFIVVRMACGIVLSLVQIRMLSVFNGGDSLRSSRLPDPVRKNFIRDLGLVGAMLGLFYILLSAVGGMDRGHVMGYPFGWLFGVGYAVGASIAAVLLDYTRRSKIIVLFVIIVFTLLGDLIVFIEASDHVFIINDKRFEIDF